MGSSEGQTYCLRWNNHKSNLVEILDALIKMESYVDCTIVVDEQIQFKAHRVVLAANSPYFQSILQDVPMDHCSILFPGVQAFEMRALLEYMYTGEVNVTQSQIPRIMKIAEQLEVKGLFDMTDLKEKFTKFEDNGPSNYSSYPPPFQPPAPPQLSGVAAIAAAALTPPTFRESSKDINRDLNERDSHHHYSSSHQHQTHHRSSTSSLNLERSTNERRLSSTERRLSIDREREYRDRSGHRSLSSSATLSDLHHQTQQQQQQSSPIISTSSNITQHQAPSSSSPSPSYLYKSPYSSLYSKSPVPSENRRSTEDRNDRFNSSSDRHERQERALHNERSNERLHDRHLSSQQQQGQMTPPPPPPPPPSATTQQHTPWPVIPPGSIPTTAAAAAMLSSVYENASDMNPLKRKKLSSISSMLMGSDTPILRNVLAQSHAADSSQPMPLVKQERENEKQASLNCSGPSDYNNDKYGKYDEPHSPFIDKSFDDEGLDCSPNERLGNLSYSSNNNSQKPEWKRYKQYTRSDILAAIECVRNGMSALQASRKFGVPSRTLYDKVKKLGITTNRPMNRTLKRSPSTGSSSASFPFGLSGTTHPAYSQAEAMLSQIHESNDYKMQNTSHLRSHNSSSNGNGNVDKDHRSEHHLPPNLSHPAAAALLDPAFLQQAFESRGGDIAGREALHAMALAAAAHAAVNGISTSPGTNGTARSPSPGFALKYSRSHQDSPPPTSTTSNINLNRTLSSTSQQHQLTSEQQQDLAEQHAPERDIDCMKYELEHPDDDDDDDNEDSRSSPHDRNLREENDVVSECREQELLERGIRNRLSRKRNLIKMEHEQDRVEDLSVNRKESTVQQEMHSPSSQPLSPSSSSQQHLSLSKNDTNNHHNTNSSYSNNSGNQQSSGVIMPPVITKLSTTTNSIPATSDYPVSLESSQKRELLTDETGD